MEFDDLVYTFGVQGLRFTGGGGGVCYDLFRMIAVIYLLSICVWYDLRAAT